MKTHKTDKTLLEASHSRSVADVLSSLEVSIISGLSEQEASQRLKHHGPNTIGRRQKVGALTILVHQFRNLVVALLGIAAGLAFYFKEWEEAFAIVGVLTVNTLIGFITEIKAVRSIEALRVLGSRSARVCRDGRTRPVPAEHLVPGDIVLLDAGDVISADLRLVEASNIEGDESTLTGESMGVIKSIAPNDVDARITDRSSMLFKGTSITRGSGIGVVVTTGLDTELGHISRLVDEAAPEASPLEKKLAKLSGQLVWVTLTLTALIAAIGLIQGKDTFLMIEAAIALAIAAIPEGLPIVATLALARGMWRMARQNALIERLSAVETLGATTVILTDKTGTLTENRMAVRSVWLPSGELVVGNSGFRTEREKADLQPVQVEQLNELLEVALLCSNAALGRVSDEDTGDPMELALLRAGRIAGLERSVLLNEYPEVLEHAFDTATKMMATVHHRDSAFLYAVKGAPETVLAVVDRCKGEAAVGVMDEATRAKWHTRVDKLGEAGLRILAFASGTKPGPDEPPFSSLTFHGLVGLEDPPRAGVADAIRACHQAGIRVVMITGDHPVTARSVARAIGLGGSAPRVIEGRHLADLDGEARTRLLETDIFARVSPSEKLELVRAYQAAGEIVAVTGDGVNDAPALRQADIGVAMGFRGTDVAREAAAMVLLDDAFPTIVGAVREGRAIFANIRRFGAYLLSCNLSEVLIVGIAILSGLPLPLLPLQILFLNLVTDVFPAFALAMGDGEPDILKRQPRDPKEPILGRSQWLMIVIHGFSLTAATFGAFVLARFWIGLDERASVTVTFLTLAFAQLWHVFNMSDHTTPLFFNEITRNRWVWAAQVLCVGILMTAAYVPSLAYMLHMTPPDIGMCGIILAMSSAPLLCGLVAKTVAKKYVRSIHSHPANPIG